MSNFKKLETLQKKMNRIASLTSKTKQKGFLSANEEIRVKKLEMWKATLAEEVINIINERFRGVNNE